MSRKRTYGTEDIKFMDVGRLLPALVAGVLIAIDVAKEKFVVAIANATGEVLSLLRFAHPTQTRMFLTLLAQLREKAGTLTVVMEPTGTYGEWRTRTGDVFSPKIANDEPLKLECRHFLDLVENGWDGREMRDGLEVVRALELLTESLRGR